MPATRWHDFPPPPLTDEISDTRVHSCVVNGGCTNRAAKRNRPAPKKTLGIASSLVQEAYAPLLARLPRFVMTSRPRTCKFIPTFHNPSTAIFHLPSSISREPSPRHNTTSWQHRSDLARIYSKHGLKACLPRPKRPRIAVAHTIGYQTYHLCICECTRDKVVRPWRI
jgi:hypothetical protein